MAATGDEYFKVASASTSRRPRWADTRISRIAVGGGDSEELPRVRTDTETPAWVNTLLTSEYSRASPPPMGGYSKEKTRIEVEVIAATKCLASRTGRRAGLRSARRKIDRPPNALQLLP